MFEIRKKEITSVTIGISLYETGGSAVSFFGRIRIGWPAKLAFCKPSSYITHQIQTEENIKKFQTSYIKEKSCLVSIWLPKGYQS